jgi:hypothetical protein
MTTQPQSSRSKLSAKSMLIVSLILFSCSYSLMAQQKDGEETNSSSNSAPARSNVNFSFNFANVTLQNGEFLEMFGANSSRAVLRGHPTIPGAELGTTTSDPLMFSTAGAERMRIWADGSITIGPTTLAPAGSALDFATNSAVTYLPNGLHPSRLRLFNTSTALNTTMEINLGNYDTAGGNSTRVRLVSIATNNTPGATAGDFVIACAMRVRSLSTRALLQTATSVSLPTRPSRKCMRWAWLPGAQLLSLAQISPAISTWAVTALKTRTSAAANRRRV